MLFISNLEPFKDWEIIKKIKLNHSTVSIITIPCVIHQLKKAVPKHRLKNHHEAKYQRPPTWKVNTSKG